MTKFLRSVAVVLCLIFVFGLGACGETEEPAASQPQQTQSLTEPTQEETTEPAPTEPERITELTADEGQLQYVMIYNPNVYKEDAVFGTQLTTGDLGSQVDTSLVKADGLEMPADYPFIPTEQAGLEVEIPYDELNLDGDRADPMVVPYSKGDQKEFYCFDAKCNRVSKVFTCLYAGEYCNVWTCDSMFNDYAASIYGKTFDEDIYLPMLEEFGTARFAENGGKVNLLFCPLPDQVAGLFCTGDIYSSTEVPDYLATLNGLNTDHAIVSVNSTYAIYSQLVDLMSGTIAHEFQHLINATDAVYALTNDSCTTWLNEAMSGYAEEMLYPGQKEDAGHYQALASSDRIRYGQSLYNFESDNSDIGVYGSVYMFSEYLAHLTGEDSVFRKFHDNWRDSYSYTICDAEGLYGIASASVVSQIDEAVTFSDNVKFANDAEAWMSKLALSFHLALLTQDENAPKAFGKIDPATLLYDQVAPVDIEGGGRVVVAVKDGVFQIPEDADDGLVYVGLDADFQPVTPFVSN